MNDLEVYGDKRKSNLGNTLKNNLNVCMFVVALCPFLQQTSMQDKNQDFKRFITENLKFEL